MFIQEEKGDIINFRTFHSSMVWIPLIGVK
jgi:hypothetical protein